MADGEGADSEGFLGRWSRLKRTSSAGEPDAAPAPDIPLAADPAPEPAEPLPALDSLDAGSDYTGFLKRDVPMELRRLALRKAWASDPVIAGFRGFAEYDWDFNAPGYGALRPTDDIKRLVDAIFPDDKPPDAEPAAGRDTEQMVAAIETPDGGTAAVGDDASAVPAEKPGDWPAPLVGS